MELPERHKKLLVWAKQMDDNNNNLYIVGKVTMNIGMSKFYLKQHKTVVFATKDQQATIAMLTEHFPRALFELVDSWGVKIHERS